MLHYLNYEIYGNILNAWTWPKCITYVWGLNMLESWKHCVARGWTEAAAAKAEAKKKKRAISSVEDASK